MQKYFRASLSRRSLALLFALSSLFVLSAALFCRETCHSLTLPARTVPADTMYRQLRAAEVSETSVPEEPNKMNNPSENHANIVTTPPIAAPVEHGTLPFSGKLRVLDAQTGQVQSMSLEEYTLCATAAEMPQSFAMEALMAQAVACRTLAVYGAVTHSKHENADVCTDYRCCQSFKRVSDTDTAYARVLEAVNGTRGIVAIFDGQPILAAYHAASAGKTRSSAEVWGGTLSYLVPVMAVEGTDVSAKEYLLTKETVKASLARWGLQMPFTFEVDESGFCTGVTDGKKTLSSGKLQALFSLRSDTFSVEGDEEGYRFISYGYGHGVGMSQHGANALADKGYDFYDILKYYYTGIGFAFVTTDETGT